MLFLRRVGASARNCTYCSAWRLDREADLELCFADRTEGDTVLAWRLLLERLLSEPLLLLSERLALLRECLTTAFQ